MKLDFIVVAVLIIAGGCVALTITALKGKPITLKYGDFSLEINHNHDLPPTDL